MFELTKNALKTMFRNKGRTMLTLLGIVIGVASVIIISNISACGSSAFSNEIDGLGMGGLTISLKNQSASLSNKELQSIQSLPYVSHAMPLIFESTDAYIKDEKSPVYLWGIDKTAAEVISLELLNGRFFNSGDISSNTKNCMIDEKLAQKYFGTDKVSGKKMMINSGQSSAQYTIVGVLKTGSGLLQNMMGNYIPEFIYIPYTTMQQNLSSNNFSQIAVQTAADLDAESAGRKIVKTIERTSGYNNAYNYTNMAKQKENIDHIIRIFSLVLSSVGVISLIVAGLSIMNVMLVSVNEQKREIGIKKALGASKGLIVVEFLAEAMMMTFVGGLIGIGIGTVVSWIGATVLGFSLIVNVPLMIGILLFSVIVGMIFGIYPSLKAADLKPIDALKF